MPKTQLSLCTKVHESVQEHSIKCHCHLPCTCPRACRQSSGMWWARECAAHAGPSCGLSIRPCHLCRAAGVGDVNECSCGHGLVTPNRWWLLLCLLLFGSLSLFALTPMSLIRATNQCAPLSHDEMCCGGMHAQNRLTKTRQWEVPNLVTKKACKQKLANMLSGVFWWCSRMLYCQRVSFIIVVFSYRLNTDLQYTYLGWLIAITFVFILLEIP